MQFKENRQPEMRIVKHLFLFAFFILPLCVFSQSTYLAQGDKQNILLEKRKERNWLSYFQMEYTDSDKALGLNENLSARVGIKLPIGGSSNKKIRELELDARSLEDQISILDTIRVFSQRVNLNFLK